MFNSRRSYSAAMASSAQRMAISESISSRVTSGRTVPGRSWRRKDAATAMARNSGAAPGSGLGFFVSSFVGNNCKAFERV